MININEVNIYLTMYRDTLHVATYILCDEGKYKASRFWLPKQADWLLGKQVDDIDIDFPFLTLKLFHAKYGW